MNQELEFAYKKPSNKPACVHDILEIASKGPWKTKSDAELIVLFALPYDDLLGYIKYDESELRQIPEDIRGLRSYSVRGLKNGSMGGMEFHRIRKELLFGLEGLIDVECEDVYRNKRNFRLDSQKGIYIPPFILHTYETIEDAGLLVIANTLFNPDDSRTHDTYPQEVFRKLQEQYK